MKSPKSAGIILDISFHMWILFTFLIIFFFTFASKIEKKAINDELDNAIKKTIPSVMEKVSPLIAKDKWPEVSEQVEIFKNKYKKEGGDPYVKENNKKLFRTSLIISGLGLLAIIFLSIYFIFYKKYDINPFKIFLEVLFVTILVGGVEALFFVNVALKYAPVNSSTLGSSFIDRLKYQINKQT